MMQILSDFVSCFTEHPLFLHSILWPMLAYVLSILVNKLYLRGIGNEHRHISYIRLLVVPVGLALLIPYTAWLVRIDPDAHWLARHFQAIRYVLHTFAIEDTLGAIVERAKEAGVPLNLNCCENAYYSFMMLLAPLSTASILLSFFKTPQLWWRIYVTCRGTQAYFFSDLNERAVTYARSLLEKSRIENPEQKKQPIMVFCMDEEKPETGDIDALNVPGAVVLRSSISTLPLWQALVRMRRIHFYLVTDDENKKLNQAKKLLEKYHGSGCHIRCISAQQTNDYEVDQLNKRYKFWDNESSKEIGKDRPCRILIQSVPGELTLSEGARPWLTIVCSAGEVIRQDDMCNHPGCLLCQHTWYVDRKLYACRFLQRLAYLPFVAYALCSPDENRNYHEAQLLYERSHGKRAAIHLCTPEKASQASQPAPADPVSAAFEHAVQFRPDGAFRDKDNREESQGIRSTFIDLLEEASNLAYVHLHHMPLLTPEFISAFYRTEAETDTAQENKPMRVLILGSGAIGEELARICLWYCQLPGMRAEVTVADQEEDSLILGKIMKDHMDIPPQTAKLPYRIDAEGNALLFVKGKVNFRSKELEELLEASETDHKGYHAIFVCSGDDDLNYRLALRLRRFYLRREPAWGCPQIRVNIWSDDLHNLLSTSDALNGNGKASYCVAPENRSRKAAGSRFNERCAVSIFGTMQESLLSDTALRFDALRYHAHYMNTDHALLFKDVRKNDDLLGIPLTHYHSYYGGTESDRRSNMAVAIHGKCKYAWQKYHQESAADESDQPSDHEILLLGEVEHRRWCIFKLLEGSSAVPADRMYPLFDLSDGTGRKTRDFDSIRGYHAVIRPWANLHEMTSAAFYDGMADVQHPDKLAVKWQGIEAGNYELARFSLALEAYNDVPLPEKGSQS